ncbi:hypothetical protein BSAF29S_06369 [Bacillus safensis subsp. safensis]
MSVIENRFNEEEKKLLLNVLLNRNMLSNY